MNLRELLDELRDGILHDVSDQIAGAQTDLLWSDHKLIRYINEAQRRFARRAQVLRDWQNPDVCQFKTVANQDKYILDKHVVSVKSVRMTGDTADLARAGHAALDTYHEPDTYFFSPTNLSTLQPGKPVAFATDEGIAQDDDGAFSSVTLRLYPSVSSAYAGVVGHMRVVRLPLHEFHYDNMELQCEIPEDHQLNMLDWAAYLALRKVDLDVAGGDARGRAKEFAASFEQHCKDCTQETKRKVFASMTWAFGRNGFSGWEN